MSKQQALTKTNSATDLQSIEFQAFGWSKFSGKYLGFAPGVVGIMDQLVENGDWTGIFCCL